MALLLNEQERQIFINDYHTLSYVELRVKYKCSSEAIKTTALHSGLTSKPRWDKWQDWEIEIISKNTPHKQAAKEVGRSIDAVKKMRQVKNIRIDYEQLT